MIDHGSVIRLDYIFLDRHRKKLMIVKMIEEVEILPLFFGIKKTTLSSQTEWKNFIELENTKIIL